MLHFYYFETLNSARKIIEHCGGRIITEKGLKRNSKALLLFSIKYLVRKIQLKNVRKMGYSQLPYLFNRHKSM